MKRILNTASLLLLTVILSAQTSFRGVIRGRIMEESTDKPFSNVTVAIYSMPDSTLKGGVATDENGVFTLQGVDEGSYYLIMSFVGYKSEIFPFLLTSDVAETDLGDFVLSEARGDAGSATVVAARPQVIYEQDKKIVRVEEFRKAGASTLAQVLENVPSVTTDSEGNVLLRGSSGYTLLIDGKPAPAMGTSLLKQIPPDMVESIEIMTNPSARYDPDGTAGIINLIMKKQKQAGFNGMLSVMAGLGDKYSQDAQVNWRKNRVNLFGGVSAMQYKTDVAGTITRETTMPGGVTLLDTELEQNAKIGSLNFNAGADITVSEQGSATVSGRFGPMLNEVEVINRLSTLYPEAATPDFSLYSNNIKVDGFFYNPSINYNHNFREKGGKLLLTVFAGGMEGDITQLLNETATNSQWTSTVGSPDIRESVLNLDIRDVRMKVDYEKPVGEKSKLETGYQYMVLTEDNDNNFRIYNSTEGTWATDDEYSNRFTMNRNVHALYTTFSSAAGKMSYQAGLRGEYVDRLLTQVTAGDAYSYEKFNLFPSAHITRTFKDNQQLQLSFSRRINRPGRNVLNPFPQFLDNQTIVKGNPEVRPEFTGSWELNYQRQIKIGFLSAETFYRQSNDLITSVIVVDETGTTFMTSDNSDRSHSAGGEFMANLQPVNWFRVMSSGSVYYYLLDDARLTSQAENSTVSWRMNTSLIFTATPTTRISLAGVYNGPSITIQGRTDGAFMLNGGVTQSLMKQKLTLSLGVRDILGTYRIRSASSGENFNFVTSIRPEYRVATLTVTYNFNNFQRRTDQQESMDMNLIR
jgi:outer membrane receptor protein involved in Fe transport